MSRNFTGSSLIRLLRDAGALDADDAAAPPDFAQVLGLWLNAFDAVALHAALQSMPTLAAAAPQPLAASVALVADGERLRATLAAAIDGAAGAAGAPAPGKWALPQTASEAAAVEAAAAADYATHYKRHLDLQRQMELRIAPFRAHVRQHLRSRSQALAQLAALDEVLEQTLGAREQRLLASVPVFLERRFDALRRSGEAALGAFDAEWRAVLRAELDHRLQPVLGLMDALGAAPGPMQVTT